METTRTTLYRLRKQMKNITLNQASLKLIAMGLMLLDHIYKIFCFDILDFLLAHTTMPQEVIQWGIQLIGMLGAASFWIFAFFIAEGCRRTRNRSAYLIRLLIMGLISEIPFQYMICILLDAPLTLHLALTNIFFTLFLGAAAIMAYNAFRSRQALPANILRCPWCSGNFCLLLRKQSISSVSSGRGHLTGSLHSSHTGTKPAGR